jgi:hypothetical protein
MYIPGYLAVILYAFLPAMVPISNLRYTRTAKTLCFGVANRGRPESGALIWTAMIANP